MAKTIISGVRVQYARQLLQDLKKMRCLVKDNKIGQEIKVGDVIEVVFPQKIIFKVHK